MIEWKGEVLRRVPEVAKILTVTPQRVHELIRKGKLKARDVGGVRYVEEAELDRFLGVPVTVDPVVRKKRQSQKASAVADRELEAMGWKNKE